MLFFSLFFLIGIAAFLLITIITIACTIIVVGQDGKEEAGNVGERVVAEGALMVLSVAVVFEVALCFFVMWLW